MVKTELHRSHPRTWTDAQSLNTERDTVNYAKTVNFSGLKSVKLAQRIFGPTRAGWINVDMFTGRPTRPPRGYRAKYMAARISGNGIFLWSRILRVHTLGEVWTIEFRAEFFNVFNHFNDMKSRIPA